MGTALTVPRYNKENTEPERQNPAQNERRQKVGFVSLETLQGLRFGFLQQNDIRFRVGAHDPQTFPVW